MNDRFRFRAWNGERMMYNANNNSPLVLMQCTGLKDKNSKLIYEGDICKIPDFSDTLFSIYFSERDACFYAWCQNGGANLTFSDEFEVIGNIYENPELLEAENE